jgi:hypothetical protein
MRPRQRVGNLDGILQGRGEPQPFAVYQVIEGLSGDVLHCDEVRAVNMINVMNGDDVRVIQGRGSLGFLNEAPLAIGVGDSFCRQHLDGDVAVEMGVAGPLNDTHAAFAESLSDLIMAERPSDHGSLPSLVVDRSRFFRRPW